MFFVLFSFLKTHVLVPVFSMEWSHCSADWGHQVGQGYFDLDIWLALVPSHVFGGLRPSTHVLSYQQPVGNLHQGCRDTGYNNTCCSSVAQSCPTLCNPMDCSTPGFPVLHPLPELAQTHVHPTISSSVVPFSSCPQSFPASGSFPMSQLFTSGGHSIGALASASVLLMNIQDWFPLGWTGLISLPSNTNNNLTQHLLSNRHSVHLIFHLWAKVYTFLKWGGRGLD